MSIHPWGRSMLALACIWLAAACSKRNEDLCCATDVECTAVGFSSHQPCDLGVCVNYACTTTPGACDDDGDCASTPATPTCVANTCSACATNAACPASAPICDATSHACRTCSADAECDSGACDLAAGTCVDEANTLYIAPLGPDGTACTKTSPCSLAHVASLVDSHHSYIVLSPGSYLANGVFDGKEATLVGNNSILAYSQTNLSISISNGGVLHLRDLTISDNYPLIGADSPTAFFCSNCDASRITLDRVTVIIGTYYLFNDITITVLNSQISANRFYARHASVDSSTFTDTRIQFGPSTLTNSLFLSTELLLDTKNYSGTVSTIIANTFASSQIQFDAQGINNHLVSENNILYNTTSSTTNTTFQRNLSLPDLSLGGSNISSDPMFADPSANDFHLKVGSPAIDQADPTVANDHDRDGTRRPKGAASDIGAFEYIPLGH